LRIDDAPDARPRPHEALIGVAAVSLNYGELAYRSPDLRPGYVSGWDAAGVVVQSAADGSGPREGTRVVSFGWGGAWAQLRAVDPAELAVVPDGVDLGAVSTLPVAGVTALQAVRRLGVVLGRRVLVTGAAGGVGRFAVQLAALAGAHVIASVGSPGRAEDLVADEIVVGADGLAGLSEPVHGVLDNVGGQHLALAFERLEDDGVVQAIGMASGRPTLIDFEVARTRSARGRLENFNLHTPVGTDLAFLVGLVAQGRLDPQIGWRGPWDRAPEAADALLARRVRGKAVLDLPPRRPPPSTLNAPASTR
jgi:NADPH:quinone reductase-like Zn-dependent oxidoreductase